METCKHSPDLACRSCIDPDLGTWALVLLSRPLLNVLDIRAYLDSCHVLDRLTAHKQALKAYLPVRDNSSLTCPHIMHFTHPAAAEECLEMTECYSCQTCGMPHEGQHRETCSSCPMMLETIDEIIPDYGFETGAWLGHEE
jgi:hypothetical protein